jgi:hypothetical protein
MDAQVDYRFFTRDKWRELYGSKLAAMHLEHHDGNLLVWFDDGTNGFVMRLEEEAPSMTNLGIPYTAAYVHPVADTLYLARGNTIWAYGAGTARRSYTWRSKDIHLPKPTNLGALQVKGTGKVSITVYADGTALPTQVVTATLNGTTVRLPSGFLSVIWSVKAEDYDTSEVMEINLANTISELKRV